MIVRPVTLEEKDRFNAAAHHPLQTWQWGEFRKAQGQTVERWGMFDDNGELQHTLQVTFHSIPIFGGTAGYFPKGDAPTADMLGALKELGKRNNAVFIKMEPNVLALHDAVSPFAKEEDLLEQAGAKPGRALFTPYTFVLDLTPTEDELMASFKNKTRYNIRLAERKGVTIIDDTSDQGLEDYLALLRETTQRQGFYAHDESYFRTQWQHLKASGMVKILKAMYEGKPLSAWVLFFHNGVAYYPYGASSRENRDVMANNLLMWEAIKLAKQNSCTSFDFWGALGPEPDPKHKWYGFHKFKEGYNAALMLGIVSHDLILNGPMYSLVTMADTWRWRYLRLRAKLGR
jgi:lipid II:glycine glycyltransferase (peptidoglycan interpeptide bridge formation enzyme)